eukprot:TRINITY_DN8429_c0_g1_i3.p2 TRINITY_DN8429_c0_g1~~TRINITY_DN8429_c0_g1_i3.p2  ORF type:complete len:104 (+),score=4.31 TRINITY_DN8429_c0_g1_i3:70-381(+)
MQVKQIPELPANQNNLLFYYLSRILKDQFLSKSLFFTFEKIPQFNNPMKILQYKKTDQENKQRKKNASKINPGTTRQLKESTFLLFVTDFKRLIFIKITFFYV